MVAHQGLHGYSMGCFKALELYLVSYIEEACFGQPIKSLLLRRCSIFYCFCVRKIKKIKVM